MKLVWILTGAVGAILLMSLLIAYLCYRMAFFVSRRAKQHPVGLPENEIYGQFRETIENWARQTREIPCEEFEITSVDGLRLRGRYYEYAPGAPIELMFHGYRGTAERDLAGGVQRCFQLGRSALIVDQRCSGKSQGNVITFGILEHRDCLKWVDFMIDHFGPDVKIYLCGISMGAATVLMAAGTPLPENVIGVLADCGYTSPKEIIQTVIREIGLPPKLAYPFVKLGAKIFGKFDLEEMSPVEAVKNCKVPVFFIHGEADDYVPCEMSRRNYEACASRKKLMTVPSAAHGLSYPVAQQQYLQAVGEFFRQ
ncbi:MAG: alpha/beta hydrolase [Oscillospiraceae bacterium]|nr:alpha/beta hydrolase [Oscillospiraceae bacterium]